MLYTRGHRACKPSHTLLALAKWEYFPKAIITITLGEKQEKRIHRWGLIKHKVVYRMS